MGRFGHWTLYGRHTGVSFLFAHHCSDQTIYTAPRIARCSRRQSRSNDIHHSGPSHFWLGVRCACCTWSNIVVARARICRSSKGQWGHITAHHLQAASSQFVGTSHCDCVPESPWLCGYGINPLFLGSWPDATRSILGRHAGRFCPLLPCRPYVSVHSRSGPYRSGDGVQSGWRRYS